MPRRASVSLIGVLLTRLFRQQSIEAEFDAKKPRRSGRISQRAESSFATEASATTEIATPQTPAAAPYRGNDRHDKNNDVDDDDKAPELQLPTPKTFLAVDDSSSEHRFKEPTATPPGGRPSQVVPRAEGGGGSGNSGSNGSAGAGDDAGSYSSPPQDTQAIPSQIIDQNTALSDEVKDEVKEGVWGYLLPLGARYGNRSFVMKKRVGCEESSPLASSGAAKRKGKKGSKSNGSDQPSSKGYLIGRHPECGMSGHPFSLLASLNS